MSSLFAKVQMYMFTGFSCMMEYYVPEDCFFSASSVVPDEMVQYAAFHLSRRCLLKERYCSIIWIKPHL